MKKSQSLKTFLKSARIHSGFSQKEVSLRLGYRSAQFVSNWERGLSVPPPKALRQLTKLYKIRAQELFDLVLEEAIRRVESNLRRAFRL